MNNTEQELDRLNEILKRHPKGLTIAEIAKSLELSRISTSKYLNILLTSGLAEMRVHGPSKVFYPSQRIPISSILNFSSSLLLVMNDNLSIIDANTALLDYFSLEKKDLTGHRIDYSPLGSYISPELLYDIKKALDSTEKRVEVNWTIHGNEKYLTIKITPTVFEDGTPGVTLIAEDVTELTLYRQKLEQLVDERSKELKITNTQLIREIEDHKVARINLQKSEQKYRELVENANSLIIRFDTSGDIIFFNEYAERFLGYAEEELIGKNILDTFVPKIDSTGQNLEHTLQDLLVNPEKYLCTLSEVIKKDETRAWIEWTNKVIKNSSGDVTGILAIGTDITTLKKAREDLVASERRYRTLYLDNPSMIGTLDCEGTIISMNSFGAEQLGYTRAELEGQSVLKLIYPEDHQTFLKQMKTSLENPGELFHWQIRKIRKSGEMVWVKEDARTVTGDGGNPELFLVCNDITGQKRNEEKLAVIINFLPDATFVIDTEGKIIAWNKAIENLTRVKAEEMIGKGNYEYSVALYNVREPALIDYALKPDKEIPPNYFNCKREGDNFFAETYSTYLYPEGIYLWGKASPLYDFSGNLIGAIESFRDITSMKRN